MQNEENLNTAKENTENLKEQKDFYETRGQRIQEKLNQSYEGKTYTTRRKGILVREV